MRTHTLLTPIPATIVALVMAWCAAWPAHATEDPTPDLHAAVTPATCGPGSQPETGLQGQVPSQDRRSGRSQQGYSCNLERVGQYQGEGATWVSAVAGHCAYMPTSGLANKQKKSPGVQVIDVSRTDRPHLVTALDTRAFRAGTWESLKASPSGKMLAGVGVGLLIGAGKFDLYDVSDCANPQLLNKSSLTGDSLPSTNFAHEGEWSPDGKTYWSSGLVAGALTAIDVSNPAKPKTLYFGGSSMLVNHGMAFNADGTRMYLASIFPAGVGIYDVSDIQHRRTKRNVRQIAKLTWQDGSISQKPLWVTIKGRPYLFVIDEAGADGMAGGIHVIDIADEANPKLVSHIRLAIQLQANAAVAKEDGANNGLFSYDAHYCSVDRVVEPTAMACGYFQAGIRVFDIRDPRQVREVAYFNPPAQVGKQALLRGSEHALLPRSFKSITDLVVNPLGALSASPESQRADLTADWCSSPPKFVNNELWTTCTDNGFMVLRFTNGAYPFKP